MLVSLNWLKHYIDIDDIHPAELAEKLTKAGIEVDGIRYIAEKSEHVVVGYIESCEKHPHADKLTLCQVDVGNETLQIVCGAPNVRAGQKVAVAKPGAILPGDVKIDRVQLRGVESNGMICSLQELGVDMQNIPSDMAEGIFVFPDDVSVGDPVEPLLNLDDAVLEFDLTPNRADCLNMLGVSYEVSAILDKPVKWPDETIHPVQEKAEDVVSVNVDVPELTPYYGAFIVKDIEIKPSPLWMRNYLIAAGIRPINNVVDITNYVLIEYGQPLHAFDFDRLGSDSIVVRRAKDGETITTLDDQKRRLSSEHLVITNGKEPVALAGVMGGANTEVHDGTTTVLLEAAYFDPFTVRKTATETGLRSESSIRFEKGVDPNRVKAAGFRACRLLEQYANASVLSGVVEFDALDRSATELEIDNRLINKRLGTSITPEETAEILNKLNFTFTQKGEYFQVTIPTRRNDIAIFEDMLEEVARIYGYDRLPYTMPKGEIQAGGLTERQRLKRAIKRYMESAGLTETITYSLVDNASANRLVSPEISETGYKPVELAMPMTEDHKYLRLSLLPGLLNVVAYNTARNSSNLAFYEWGKVFLSQEDPLTKQPMEHERLSGTLTSLWIDHPWQQEKKPVDFYVVKGIIEGLFRFLEIPVAFRQARLEDMHPGRCAVIKWHAETIGFIGQIHPKLAKEKELPSTYVFDINLEKVLAVHTPQSSYTPIPKYPSISRDIAFIVDDDVQAGDVQQTIETEGAPLVEQVHLFDVYKGEHLPKGKKSLAYNIVYRDVEKTLTDEEIDSWHGKIVDAVNQTHRSYIRS